MVTVVPDTVHTASVPLVNATVNPELAVAVNVNEASLNVLLAKAAKVIV